jgi:glutathione S-transferase
MIARFYYSPRSVALASHIVLEHVGADFEAIRVDFQANQQRSAEYLAINAKGRVPTLVTERGVITETPAILLYLAQTHPQSGVAPLDDPFALAQLQAVNSWFCSTVHVANAHGSRGTRWADDAAAVQAMKAKVAPNMIECFDWIERELLRGPWMMGKDFSVADPYLFTVTLWLMQNGVDLARFPRVADHYQRMLALPAVQKIAPLHNL